VYAIASPSVRDPQNVLRHPLGNPSNLPVRLLGLPSDLPQHDFTIAARTPKGGHRPRMRASEFYGDMLPRWQSNTPVEFAFDAGAVAHPVIDLQIAPEQ
jgi:hypothetical protein